MIVRIYRSGELDREDTIVIREGVYPDRETVSIKYDGLKKLGFDGPGHYDIQVTRVQEVEKLVEDLKLAHQEALKKAEEKAEKRGRDAVLEAIKASVKLSKFG